MKLGSAGSYSSTGPSATHFFPEYPPGPGTLSSSPGLRISTTATSQAVGKGARQWSRPAQSLGAQLQNGRTAFRYGPSATEQPTFSLICQKLWVMLLKNTLGGEKWMWENNLCPKKILQRIKIAIKGGIVNLVLQHATRLQQKCKFYLSF